MKIRSAATLIFACFAACLMVACSSSKQEKAADRAKVHHRIIALAPNIAELVYASGAGEYLVGAVDYADYPEAVKLLPRVGDAMRVDTERLLSLQPDLILIWPSGTPPSVVEQVKSLGIEVQEIDAQRLAEISKAMRLIGSLSGTASAASDHAQLFDQQIEALKKRYRRSNRVSVFIEVNREPLYTVNDKQIISEVVDLCGGNNVFADLNQLAATVSVEAVIAKDPEIIITTDGTIEQLRTQWQQWPQLRAINHRRIYSIKPDPINRAAPRIVDGIKEVCEALRDK